MLHGRNRDRMSARDFIFFPNVKEEQSQPGAGSATQKGK
jgi:hypothetical protein